MKQEEKNLLLKDLCGRLPYGVKVHYQEEICSIDCICPDGRILLIDKYGTQLPNIGDNLFEEIDNIKLYLRSMSSMTEEEKVEYCDLQDKFLLSSQYPVSDGYVLFDWLNAHHFNYRLPNSLFIEAPEEIYKEQNGKVEH